MTWECQKLPGMDFCFYVHILIPTFLSGGESVRHFNYALKKEMVCWTEVIYWHDVCTNSVVTLKDFLFFCLQQCRDLCILQLSGVPLWNLALLISVGLHSLQRTQRVLGERLFIACFKSLTSQSHVSTTQQTLRTIAAENNFKQWATWPQQHQMNPYRGGRRKEKQFCHLNIIKKHDRFPSFSFQRSWG